MPDQMRGSARKARNIIGRTNATNATNATNPIGRTNAHSSLYSGPGQWAAGGWFRRFLVNNVVTRVEVRVRVRVRASVSASQPLRFALDVT